MDISKVHCPDCDKAMKLTAATCPGCGLKLEGDFEVSALGFEIAVRDVKFDTDGPHEVRVALLSR